MNHIATNSPDYRRLWQLSLGCFILAGLTGFAYRLGLVGTDLWGLSLENIRHAHSHLMFFCWAVPLPMYFMLQKMGLESNESTALKLMQNMALAALFLGIASYPFFLFYGYRPVTLGELSLPFSVIFSGLVMLCWYGFIAGYWKLRATMVSRDLPIMFFDSSLLMLFISSLGAWGVAVVQFAGVEGPLFGKALTHFFLATFTEGWVVLMLLGLLYERLDIDIQNIKVSQGLLSGLILFGAPLTFPYGISQSLLTQQLLLAAKIGGLLAAAGLLLNLWVLFHHSKQAIAWYWKGILLLLGLKALGQLVASVVPANFWLSEHGLRIFYLHLLLLGAFSLGLFTGLGSSGKVKKALKSVFVSVVLVLTSLIWLTSLWPQAWFSAWQFYATTAIALLPSLAGLHYFMVLYQQQKNQPE